jgi:hypothetical protein
MEVRQRRPRDLHQLRGHYLFDRLLVDRPKRDSGAPGLGPLFSLKKATVKETVAFSGFPSAF